MIREYCDKCEAEFAYPIMKGGTMTLQLAYEYAPHPFVLCTTCYNEIAKPFGCADADGVPDEVECDKCDKCSCCDCEVDNPDVEAYNASMDRVLANDEPDGIPI